MKKINFTGSSGVGAIISSIAGKHLKPVVMELGGKASSIVLKDADLTKAAENCARGAFFNVGYNPHYPPCLTRLLISIQGWPSLHGYRTHLGALLHRH
jgi:hypothetical protein